MFVCRAYLRQFRDGRKATSGERERERDGEREGRFRSDFPKGPKDPWIGLNSGTLSSPLVSIITPAQRKLPELQRVLVYPCMVVCIAIERIVEYTLEF